VTTRAHEQGTGDRALAAAGALGPFFQVDRKTWPEATTWADLTGDTDVLSRRVAEVRAVLGAGPGAPVVQPPVAASLTQLGLVARLVSPLLGAWLLTGLLPVAPAEQVYLRPSGSNPIPICFDGAVGVAVPQAGELAGELAASWLRPAIEPLADAVRRSFSLSRRVLEGNVSSAVAGALRMASAARPEVARRAEEILDALLAGPLAGTGRRLPDGRFVRRSCCLLYRLPGAGTCLDCILTER
jgi:ferric iron reductase protein FhuF